MCPLQITDCELYIYILILALTLKEHVDLFMVKGRRGETAAATATPTPEGGREQED